MNYVQVLGNTFLERLLSGNNKELQSNVGQSVDLCVRLHEVDAATLAFFVCWSFLLATELSFTGIFSEIY